MRTLPSRLLAVTERSLADPPLRAAHRLIETTEGLLAAGIRWVWFRERDLPDHARRTLARAVAERVRAHGGFLTIGGDPVLAAELGADGVHLPGGTTPAEIERARTLLPNGLLGISAHAIHEVDAAFLGGADYATLSPIFATASKPGYGPALGPGALTRAAALGLPILALGGVTAERVETCYAAGAAGVAVMGSLMRSPDPGTEARRFLAFESGRSDRP